MPYQTVLDIIARIDAASTEAKKQSQEAIDARTAADKAQADADKLADDADVQAQEALAANTEKAKVIDAALADLRKYYESV
jgi:hypothetical protein